MLNVPESQAKGWLALAILGLALAIVFLFAPIARAEPNNTITVNTLADSVANDGLCSLREAIQSANAGMPVGNCASGALGPDTINITVTGTIVLGLALPDITQDVNIVGPGAGILTISGNNAVRGLKINSGISVNISGLTIAKGFASSLGGGGIYNAGTLTITNSTIYDNSASAVGGGGILNSGVITLTHSAVYSNTATSAGGGIYNQVGGPLTLVDSDVYSNTATNNGGGIAATSATVNVTNSRVYGNTTNDGGGISINNSVLNVSNSSIYGNSGIRGGGIASSNTSTLVIYNSAIYDNRATLFAGGGMYINQPSAPNITLANTTIFSNTAQTSGGGIFSGFNLTLINSTLAANKASSNSGGNIEMNTGAATLKNTMVVNSTQSHNCSGSIVDGGNNLQFGGTLTNSCGDTIPTADPKLLPLGNYGGSTKTMALSIGSAAIDAGSDAVCAAVPINNLDQRGYVRPLGAHCDVGAFEGIIVVLNLPLILK